MALAQGAFAMLGIATTVLTSLGRERTSALLTLAAVIAVGAACALFVPEADFGHEQLVRSAQACAGALVATLVVAGSIVHAKTGAFVPAATVARTGLALSACVALGFVVPRVGRLATPVLALAVGTMYVGLLVLTREIGPADLAMIRTLASRKAK